MDHAPPRHTKVLARSLSCSDSSSKKRCAKRMRASFGLDGDPIKSMAASRELLIESARSECMIALRSRHAQSITQCVGVSPPKLSFNRWLIERDLCAQRAGIAPEARDPVLPALCGPHASPSLMREILDDVPLKVCLFPRDRRHALDGLMAYAKACVKLALDDTLLGALRLDGATVQAILESVDHTKQWSRTPAATSVEAILDKLGNLMTVCGGPLRTKMEPVVRHVCERLAVFADTMAGRLKNDPPRAIHTHLVVMSRADTVEFSMGAWRACIARNRLEGLYRAHGQWVDRNSDGATSVETVVRDRIARLLMRYQSVTGDSKGTTLQAALPGTVFDVLERDFDVRFECFASPLNCHRLTPGGYCSAFPDTDVPFGSRGSFFDFEPEEGSFQANPPFTEEMIDAMADHIDGLLAGSSLPLSFAVFVPDWRDARGLVKMLRSPSNRGTFLLEAKKHVYVDGAQHALSKETSFAAVHATRVILLQNDAGSQQWPLTPEKQARLCASAHVPTH